MLWKINVVGFALLFNVFYLYALDFKDEGDKKPIKESYITLNVLAPLNSYSPRWRAGFIKSLNEKWKTSMDIGYGKKSLSFLKSEGLIENQYKLLEVRSEMYRFINFKSKTKLYYSLELFYINHKDTFHNGSFYDLKTNALLIYDKADYYRHKYGYNLKSGLMINVTERIGFNCYLGFGMRIRTMNYLGVENPVVNINPPADTPLDTHYLTHTGVNLNLNLSFGIKIYFILK